MADERKRDVPGGQVNVIRTVSTADILKKLQDEAKNLAAQKYKPPASTPQYKGRDPVATVTTTAVDEHNRKEATDKAKEKYEPAQPSPYHLGPRHRPGKTTDDFAQAMEAKKKADEEAKQKAEALARQKAEQKKRDDYLATVQAQADGTFKPPGNPPTTLAELKKTKAPAADFAAGKFVTTKDGKKYTWAKGAWTDAK